MLSDTVEKQSILITGGAGFIGSALIRNLLKSTNYMIFNIDKIGYAGDLDRIDSLLLKLPVLEQKRYKFFNINLEDIEEIYKVFQLARPDIVIHLAAESHVDRSIESPVNFVKNNVNGTLNILEIAFKYYKQLVAIKQKEFRFIQVSTDEVFGTLGPKGSFSESSPYLPRSPYSASKAASDHLVRSWHSTYGLPVIVTHCSNNYGPWQFPEKLIPLTIHNALSSQPIPIYGDGKQIRDWLYVDDHVDALMKVMLKGRIGETYCIGGSHEITNIELVDKICSVMDQISSKKIEYNIIFVNDRLGHDRRYSIDSSRIFNELGWKPKDSFDINLKFTIRWYLDNIKWTKSIKKRTENN
tara:strand:- start:19974 stop:21038 length:1065 start_codon:yes stop_codon:yes gene_type:complete